jgi:2-polyprenyl-3-methyl-5-hydroxy-6-metoxy-1,4-benzoquinol methylase
MPLRDLLAIPILYQAFQNLGGFYSARLSAIERYVRPKSGDRVIDIGCGPGYLVRDLPKGITYFGFDLDETYISYANRRFGMRGQFFCCHFDDAAARRLGPVDVAMMNGVLHHIPDSDITSILSAVHNALRPGGTLFTLDGAYTKEQTRFSRYMLKHDRGRHVRTPEQYIALLETVFESVETHVHEDLARIPYTFFVAVSRKAPLGDAKLAPPTM